jgi:hypothetical protein
VQLAIQLGIEQFKQNCKSRAYTLTQNIILVNALARYCMAISKRMTFNSILIQSQLSRNNKLVGLKQKLKSYIQSKGCDKIEGIYENTGSSDKMAPKYKVAVRKINGIYYLIYLSGAHNTGNWT